MSTNKGLKYWTFDIISGKCCSLSEMNGRKYWPFRWYSNFLRCTWKHLQLLWFLWFPLFWAFSLSCQTIIVCPKLVLLLPVWLWLKPNDKIWRHIRPSKHRPVSAPPTPAALYHVLVLSSWDKPSVLPYFSPWQPSYPKRKRGCSAQTSHTSTWPKEKSNQK